MSLRAAPEAGKLSPPKFLPWVNQTLCATKPLNARTHKTHENSQKQTSRNFTKADKGPLWQLGPTLWAIGLVHQMRRRTTNTNTKHATYWLQPKSVHNGSWQQGWCANLPKSDVKQGTANLCTMKYLKARSQTTAEPADSPMAIQK